MPERIIKITMVFFLLISVYSVAPLESATKVTKLDAAGIENNACLVNVREDNAGVSILLDDTELIEDDGPATGNPEGYSNPLEWKEDLKKGVVIKKILMLEKPDAWSGQLVFKAIEMKGNSTPLHISLNGVEFIRLATLSAYPFARQYIDLSGWDRWFFVDVPVGALKDGPNEILMWADSESTSWRILIALEQEFARGSLERTQHPNRSMKSLDGGKTWNDNSLGNMNSVDGEYSIRLSLDRHIPSGEYMSPIIDIVEGECPLKKMVKISRTHIMFDADVPVDTDVAVFVRFGLNPLSEDTSWSEWEKVNIHDGASDTQNRRYFQWKAELSTDNPLKSPLLKGITISTEWKELSSTEGAGVQVKVIHNGHVARSSYISAYEDLLHPGLKTFRENHKLDRIVKGATSEFEIMMRLLNWAYRIPVSSEEYSWDWNKVTIIKKGKDGMPELQTDYKGRRRDAMCLYSNQALIAALLSMGFQARHINIHSEGISGHEVTEVWSNEFNKWIYMDATRDYYYFDKDTGIPMNLLEIHNLLACEVPRVETIEHPFVPEMGEEVAARIRIGMREGDNPFSIVEDGRHILELMGHFRIIPRNDFLSNPYPVPVHTGNTMWGWCGFLNYYDEKFPKRREYQIQTNRTIDFYEPLNQAEVFLSETDECGVLEVEVDTFTPGGFDTFLVQVNGEDWDERREQKWLWALKCGMNTLKVRTRNVRGVLGPVSHLEVTYNP